MSGQGELQKCGNLRVLAVAASDLPMKPNEICFMRACHGDAMGHTHCLPYDTPTCFNTAFSFNYEKGSPVDFYVLDQKTQEVIAQASVPVNMDAGGNIGPTGSRWKGVIKMTPAGNLKLAFELVRVPKASPSKVGVKITSCKEILDPSLREAAVVVYLTSGKFRKTRYAKRESPDERFVWDEAFDMDYDKEERLWLRLVGPDGQTVLAEAQYDIWAMESNDNGLIAHGYLPITDSTNHIFCRLGMTVSLWDAALDTPTPTSFNKGDTCGSPAMPCIEDEQEAAPISGSATSETVLSGDSGSAERLAQSSETGNLEKQEARTPSKAAKRISLKECGSPLSCILETEEESSGRVDEKIGNLEQRAEVVLRDTLAVAEAVKRQAAECPKNDDEGFLRHTHRIREAAKQTEAIVQRSLDSRKGFLEQPAEERTVERLSSHLRELEEALEEARQEQRRAQGALTALTVARRLRSQMDGKQEADALKQQPGLKLEGVQRTSPSGASLLAESRRSSPNDYRTSITMVSTKNRFDGQASKKLDNKVVVSESQATGSTGEDSTSEFSESPQIYDHAPALTESIDTPLCCGFSWCVC